MIYNIGGGWRQVAFVEIIGMKARNLVGLLSMLLWIGGVGLPDRHTVLAQEEDNISFRWAFGALVGPANAPRLVPIVQDTTLKTGDQLKMLVELQKPCFVYVIYHNPSDTVHWLFPADSQPIDAKKRYEIPPGDAWFKLDGQVGRETFYLLAAAQPLTELESLLSTYATAAAADKPPQAARILTEIREIKKRYRQFSTLAERPVPIAGNMRGPEIADLAIEITANNFYSKTFTIEHR
jgi:hypothetical protein